MRTRAFDVDAAAEAALRVFLERGYEGTSLADLESATGLARSSIYQAFGSKRGLFDAAVERYLRGRVDPDLAPLERPGAGLRELRGYLAGLAGRCVNPAGPGAGGSVVASAMAELGSQDPAVAELARAHQARLELAFANALRGAATNARGFAGAERTARLLAVWTLGIFSLARVDPTAAAARCEEVADFVAGRW